MSVEHPASGRSERLRATLAAEPSPAVGLRLLGDRPSLRVVPAPRVRCGPRGAAALGAASALVVQMLSVRAVRALRGTRQARHEGVR